MKKLLLALILGIIPSLAWGQCSGVFPANTVCGNNTGSAATPSAKSIASFSALFANPTASIGLTTINGIAATAMRSDAAPALNQAIVPTWSGVHTFSLAPVFTDQAGTRTALGLGTFATQNYATPPIIGGTTANTVNATIFNLNTLSPYTGAVGTVVGSLNITQTDPTMSVPVTTFDTLTTGLTQVSVQTTWTASQPDTSFRAQGIINSGTTAGGSGVGIYGGVLVQDAGHDPFGILGIIRNIIGATLVTPYGTALAAISRGDVATGGGISNVDLLSVVAENTDTQHARNGIAIYSSTATNSVDTGIWIYNSVTNGLKIGGTGYVIPTYPLWIESTAGNNLLKLTSATVTLDIGTNNITLDGVNQQIRFGGINSITRTIGGGGAGALTLETNASDIILSPTGVTTTAKQIVSTLAAGTAPFSVASTTNVANLNASSLNGATFAAPGTIGGTTPGIATFTTLTAQQGTISKSAIGSTTQLVVTNTGADAGVSDSNARFNLSSSNFTNANWDFYTGNKTLDGVGDKLDFRNAVTATVFVVHPSGGISVNTFSDPGVGLIYQNSASFLMRTKTTWSNGAAAGAGTILNAPAAGNPTKWIPVDDNGTTRYVPAW